MNATETDRKQFLSELNRLTYPELIARFRFAADEIQTLTESSTDTGPVGSQFIADAVDRHTWQQEMIGAMIEERNRAQAVRCSLEPKNGNGKGDEFLPASDVMEAYQRTETGDAELLQKLYVDKIVFDHSKDKWHIWNGQYWESDKKDSVRLIIENQIASQYYFLLMQKKHAGLPEDSQLAKGLYQRSSALRYRSRINNVLKLAESMPHLAVTGDEWDANPMLLGVLNGTLDLKTGKIKNGDPRDYIRTVATTKWNPDATCPRWEQFLTEIFDNNVELCSFIKRLFGYSITGLSIEHIFPILWGDGRNGKDTLLETLKFVLGENLATSVQSEVLLENKQASNSATPHLAAMQAKRLCWVNETNDGAMLNTGQVKMLTGGGTIAARPLYGTPITFEPQYTLLLMTNHKPHASDDDYALWQRVYLIPFTQAFVENPVQDNEHKRDPKLKETLKLEGEGILKWLVDGCLEWQKNGLNPPECVRIATEEYRDGEDTTGQFIDQCCVESATTETQASKLFDAYRQWADRNGIAKMTSNAFGRRMTKKFKKTRTNKGNCYAGVGLVSDTEVNEDRSGLNFLLEPIQEQ